MDERRPQSLLALLLHSKKPMSSFFVMGNMYHDILSQARHLSRARNGFRMSSHHTLPSFSDVGAMSLSVCFQDIWGGFGGWFSEIHLSVGSQISGSAYPHHGQMDCDGAPMCGVLALQMGTGRAWSGRPRSGRPRPASLRGKKKVMAGTLIRQVPGPFLFQVFFSPWQYLFFWILIGRSM